MPFASTILMVRPVSFGFNEETAINNSFQQRSSMNDLQRRVQDEFDEMVAKIRSTSIEVTVVTDTPRPVKPDAIFPNNWFCTMPDGGIALFPMFAPNRRTERRTDIIDQLKREFKVSHIEDWSSQESKGYFLEGTGSMVMDHSHRIIYACLSERTNVELLHDFGRASQYDVVTFNATDRNGLPIYHTNVVMCVGNGFCVACTEAIDSKSNDALLSSLKRTSLQLISISYEQMLQFAGNMLQLQNDKGDFFLVMSEAAFNSLRADQRNKLENHTQLLPVNIDTIETIGGGSARCMMAEIFLSRVTP